MAMRHSDFSTYRLTREMSTPLHTSFMGHDTRLPYACGQTTTMDVIAALFAPHFALFTRSYLLWLT